MGGCVKCGAELSAPPTGRPPTYCSTGCRRATEYELRRLQRRLERLEEDLGWLRPLRPDVFTIYGKAGPAVAQVTADIAEAEARMRELLDTAPAS